MNLLRPYAWHYGIDPLFAKHKSLRIAGRISKRLAGIKPRHADNAEVMQPGWRNLMNPDFASQTNMGARYDKWRKTLMNSARSEREGHYRALVQPLQSFALEVHDGAAAAFGLEKRYHFGSAVRGVCRPCWNQTLQS